MRYVVPGVGRARTSKGIREIVAGDDVCGGGERECCSGGASFVLVFIIGCEIGFWVLLALGLALRYLVRARRASDIALLSVPLVDVVLLVATVIDLRSSETVATWQHGLAAAYLGYMVVFGHRTIRWADAWVGHRFGDGPPPRRPPSGGMARARYEWAFWFRILIAYGVTCGLLVAAIWMVGDPARTAALSDFMIGVAKVTLIALIWPVSYTIWPKKEVKGS
ncbi:hypothetical protein [Sphaerimonospora mesophila]|uniref:hypothetical protein n=1 Tax=Sphaerimonospora mesophila TaxID=37483 RepID=UPI001F1E9463